jgi:hypothetical protein
MAGFVLHPLFAVSLLAQAPAASLEYGSISGEPGGVVDVPVIATFANPLRSLWAGIRYDPERLEFLEYHVEGSAAGAASPPFLFQNKFAPGDAIFGIEDNRSGPGELYHVPPGVRQPLGNLRFRVLAAAEAGSAVVKPVKNVPGTAGSTGFFLDPDATGASQTLDPELIPGSVTVLPPQGPRPVGDLVCEQFLDRIHLSFTLTQAYDEIEVSRDGSRITTLPGSQTAFIDQLSGIGSVSYSVQARRGAAVSIASTCEVLAVSPAAPPVRDLACFDGALTWTSPLPYDRLTIFRNSEQIAQLPGESQGFQDATRFDSLTFYTIVGELEGFRSPDVSCVDHGVWIMEIGDVQVPVGADRVLVPVFVTTSSTVQGLEFHILIDQTRFKLIRDMDSALAGTVGFPDPEFFGMGQGPSKNPAAGIVYDYNAPAEPEKDLPVGLRQHVINFPFQPLGSFSEGDSFPVTFEYGGFTLRVGPIGVESQDVDLYIPGEIRFGTGGGPAAVKSIQAMVAPGGAGGGQAGQPGRGTSNISLSWQNASSYEKLRVERNGLMIAEVHGQATGYVDAQVAGGVYTYKVVGLDKGKASFPATILLSTLSPPGAFLRGDANRDGKINIADPIATLNFLFYDGPSLPCEDAADSDDDGRLNLTDAIITIHYLFLGDAVLKAPGATYPWFDPTPDGITCKS